MPWGQGLFSCRFSLSNPPSFPGFGAVEAMLGAREAQGCWENKPETRSCEHTEIKLGAGKIVSWGKSSPGNFFFFFFF